MITIEEYQRLKKQEETLKEKLSQDKAKLELAIEQSKREYDCVNLEELKELEEELEDKLVTQQREYEEALEEYLEKYEGKLKD